MVDSLKMYSDRLHGSLNDLDGLREFQGTKIDPVRSLKSIRTVYVYLPFHVLHFYDCPFAF